MRRGMAVVASLGLVLVACGGDDSADDDAVAEASEASEAVESAEATDETEATEPEPTDDDGADTAPTTATDDSGADDGDDGDDGDGGGRVIRSFDDIPAECRDQMSAFLREIEPIVAGIDWETATLADFETIGEEFDAASADFEAASAANGCDDLEFTESDDEFELLIDFAGGEAPGTVEFLEFISSFGDAVGATTGGDSGDGDGSGDAAAFTDCAGAIAFVQGLMAEYDSYLEVPASQLVQFGSLATVFPTCTPDQLEFFDGAEFEAFLGE